MIRIFVLVFPQIGKGFFFIHVSVTKNNFSPPTLATKLSARSLLSQYSSEVLQDLIASFLMTMCIVDTFKKIDIDRTGKGKGRWISFALGLSDSISWTKLVRADLTNLLSCHVRKQNRAWDCYSSFVFCDWSIRFWLYRGLVPTGSDQKNCRCLANFNIGDNRYRFCRLYQPIYFDFLVQLFSSVRGKYKLSIRFSELWEK